MRSAQTSLIEARTRAPIRPPLLGCAEANEGTNRTSSSLRACPHAGTKKKPWGGDRWGGARVRQRITVSRPEMRHSVLNRLVPGLVYWPYGMRGPNATTLPSRRKLGYRLLGRGNPK